MHALEELQLMSYKELQILAKSTGACKANAKSVAMAEALALYYQTVQISETAAPVAEVVPVEDAAPVAVEAPGLSLCLSFFFCPSACWSKHGPLTPNP
jgi:hypothetical protein